MTCVMAMRSAMGHIAPAVAAVSLVSSRQASDDETTGTAQRYKRRWQHPCRQASLQCHVIRENQLFASPSRGLVIKSAQNQSIRKGLLGQDHWIYRLVSSEDIHSVYEFESELRQRQSSFGTVYAARHKETGYRHAVRVAPVAGEERDQLMNEIYALMKLDHPLIVKISRVYVDKQNLYIASDLCTGPSLHERIEDGPMSEQEAARALRHVLKAVQCCHGHYMGHFDLRPENFMYSDADCKKLKMIDKLGLSSGFQRNATEFGGTVEYSAPEVGNGVRGPEADVWSCGVILYVMVTQKMLCPTDLPDEKILELLQNRRWVQSRLKCALTKNVSAECFDLLCKMLCSDRHLRITVRDALEHPFIRDASQKGPHALDAAFGVIRNMVDSFVDFGTEPVLVRAALLVMVHIAGYASHETDTHRLAFSVLDPNGLGELSVDLIESVMLDYGLVIPQNLDDAFRVVDLNRDGYISFGDFLSATLPNRLRCREDLCRRVFSLLDHNRDGFIDQDDLVATFINKDHQQNKEFLDLCRLAIEELTFSPDEVRFRRINFNAFFEAVLGSRSPISTNSPY